MQGGADSAELAELGARETGASGAQGHEDEGDGETVRVGVHSTGGEEAATLAAEPKAGEVGNVVGARV